MFLYILEFNNIYHCFNVGRRFNPVLSVPGWRGGVRVWVCGWLWLWLWVEVELEVEVDERMRGWGVERRWWWEMEVGGGCRPVNPVLSILP